MITEKMHIVHDLAKCVGCFNCMVACKDEHVGNSWLPYTEEQQKHEQKWINPEKRERGSAPFTEMCFVTKLCQHCGNAPCEKAAPDAVTRRDDGVVLLDVEKARGNKGLVDACPYGRISWNEERQIAQKCTMCAHLLDEGWKEPRCVQACPLRALSAVRCSDAEFESMVTSQGLEPLAEKRPGCAADQGVPAGLESAFSQNGEKRPESENSQNGVFHLRDGKSPGADALGNAPCDNAPRVMYRNLYKYNTCFIAGALAYRDGDIERAAAEAKVELLKDGAAIAEEMTDFFGEFKIDHIPKNSGTYELVFSLEGFDPLRREVTVGDASPCLDVMMF